MNRPGSSIQHSAITVEPSRPARWRRRHRGAPGDPTRVTTTPVAPAAGADFNTRIARALDTTAGAAALLPLESTRCDGGCAIPAVYDRATGTWRHLTDLRRCQRPATPSEDGADR